MEIKIATRLLLLFYFSVVFIMPNPLPLDIDTWRLLSYSVVNTLSLGLIYFNGDLTSLFFKIIKSKISIAIVGFTAWAFASYFYAVNVNEVLLRSFYFVNFYISFIAIYCFVKFNKPTGFQIGIFLLINFLIHASSSYFALYDITRYYNYDFSFNSRLMGFYPNRNITQAVYLIHLPFIIYVYNYSKSTLIKIISGLSAVLLVNIVFLMGARTSYVIFIALLIIAFFVYIKDVDFRKYIKAFVITFLIGFVLSSAILGTSNSAFVTNRTSTIDFQEESTSTRLRYYKYGVEEFFSNPLIGVGMGNWKIHSINMDKEFIKSYIIPYTMHNDFLEVAVELGIVGLVFFSLIFYFTVINLWKLYSRYKNKEIALIFFLAILVYLIDSMFNFPFTRSSQLFTLVTLISLSQYLIEFENENSN